MTGETISFRGGDETFQGYLAKPLSGHGPGVIVLQEWWGIVEHIRDVCDRLANSGFSALAPDLYRGASTTEPDEAETLMMALNIDQTEVLLKSAIDYLQASPVCDSDTVGVVGFCMGGQLALFAAGANTAISAVADFYGIHPKVQPNYAAIEANILGIFAELDPSVDAAAVAQLHEDLSLANVGHTFRTFKGCHHAFFNDTRKSVYDANAAQQAWGLLLDHFDEHLR